MVRYDLLCITLSNMTSRLERWGVLGWAWAGWPNKIVPYKDRRWYDKWGSNVKFLNIVLLKAGSLKSCIEAHSLSQLIVIALMIVNSWDTQNKIHLSISALVAHTTIWLAPKKSFKSPLPKRKLGMCRLYK